MVITLSVLHYFVCIVLILVILLQAGRGHGLANTLGAESTQSLFGTKTATFMTKFTSVCAIVFILTALTLDIFISKKAKSIVLNDKNASLPVDLQKAVEKMASQAAETAPTAEQATTAVEQAQATVQAVTEEAAANVQNATAAVPTEEAQAQ